MATKKEAKAPAKKVAKKVVAKVVKAPAVEKAVEKKVEDTGTANVTSANRGDAGTPPALTYKGKKIVGLVQKVTHHHGRKFLKFTVEGLSEETFMIPEAESGDIKEA